MLSKLKHFYRRCFLRQRGIGSPCSPMTGAVSRFQLLTAAICLLSGALAPAATLTLTGFDTGGTETPVMGELNAFTNDSDSGGTGTTLTVTATATATTASGDNHPQPGDSNADTEINFINSGFAFGTSLTLGVGESIESSNVSISIPTGGFDDGFLVKVDGSTILSFNQFDWTNSDIPSVFQGDPAGDSTGPWAPWLGEGNPTLVIGDGSMQLFATANSNGEGDLSDVSNGTTIDLLPHLDSVSGGSHPFVRDLTPELDLISGFSFEIYNNS